MARVLTAAFRERRTVSAVVVWISHTVKNASATWAILPLMENNVTSARYIYMSPSRVFYIPIPRLYKSDYYFRSRYRYTFSRLCLLTELRKAAHRTTHCNQQHHSWNFPTCHPIRRILWNTYQHTSTRHRGHRSRRFTATRVLTRLFFYSLFFCSL